MIVVTRSSSHLVKVLVVIGVVVLMIVVDMGVATMAIGPRLRCVLLALQPQPCPTLQPGLPGNKLFQQV